jgi:AcrR family transcriptional regulator
VSDIDVPCIGSSIARLRETDFSSQQTEIDTTRIRGGTQFQTPPKAHLTDRSTGGKLNDQSSQKLMADGPDTRRRILEVAFRLFHEQGYHATSVSTILREAGINSGSLYHFFPSKEALLEAVLEWALDALRPEVMDRAEAATDDPIERIFALLANYRTGMQMFSCRMGCPIGNLALEVADDHPRARGLIHRNFENWADVVEGWLRTAGDRLPAPLDRRQLARFVLTVMEGGIMQARAAGDLRPFDDTVAQFRAYLNALQAQAKSEKFASQASKETAS